MRSSSKCTLRFITFLYAEVISLHLLQMSNELEIEVKNKNAIFNNETFHFITIVTDVPKNKIDFYFTSISNRRSQYSRSFSGIFYGTPPVVSATAYHYSLYLSRPLILYS